MTSPNPVDLLAFALSEQRTVMTDPTGSVTVELTADGTITAIRLSEAGHQMTPAMVAEVIMSLHTAGLTQAQQAIEATLSDGEMPMLPTELHRADASAPPTPETHAAASPSPTVPTTFSTLERPSELARPSPRPQSTPAQSTVEQPALDLPLATPRPSTAGVARATHPELPAPPPSPRSGPAPKPVYAEDPIDEDEYFRTFSVFEYDDHNPRG